MNTKKCENCGAEFLGESLATMCPYCGTLFARRTCFVCNVEKPVEEMVHRKNICKACKIRRDVESKRDFMRRLDEAFDAWLDKVRKVPKDYPSLTEEQWLEACRHFDGCARCGSSEIDSRGFFVGAAIGGKYSDWNVIPLCEKCASSWNLNKSAFRYTVKRAGNERNPGLKKNMIKIVEYLERRLDRATNSTGEIGKTEDA